MNLRITVKSKLFSKTYLTYWDGASMRPFGLSYWCKDKEYYRVSLNKGKIAWYQQTIYLPFIWDNYPVSLNNYK